MVEKGKGKQIDFIVSTGNPNDASNSANKKRVRSVAALKSWPERRRKIFEQLGESAAAGNGQGAFLVDEPDLAPPPKRKHSTVPKRRVDETVQQIAGPARQPPPPAPTAEQSIALGPLLSAVTPAAGGPIPGSSIALYHQALTRGFNFSDAETGIDYSVLARNTPCQCPECRYIRRLGAVSNSQYVVPGRKKRLADGSEKTMDLPGDMAMITPPSSPEGSPSVARVDPFNCYPVPYEPWFDNVLHHMLTVYAPRGWPALKISNKEGVEWEWFLTQLALSEPALFWVRLLFGSGDMIKKGALQPQLALWLRAQAIKLINEALNDPVRCCSVALILATGRIALHEHIYGNRDASSNIHRPAQKRMIDMRGGMKALEVSPLIKRLMRWSDRIMAVGSGSQRYLEDDETNPNFTLQQSVAAIEKWTPDEMPRLRSTIKISELVNDDDE